MPADAFGQWANSLLGDAVTRKANFDELIQEIAQFTIPREATYTETVTEGQERTRYIIDSTAPRALELFASFLATTAHNPSSRFYRTKGFLDNRDVSEDVSVKKYLEQIDETIWTQMNAANVQSQLHKIDIDLGYAGTGALMIEKNNDPDAAARVKYMVAPFQDVYIFEDEDGRVDKIIRVVEWTAEQWKKKFPDIDFSGRIGDLLKAHNSADASGKRQTVKGMHIVFPNTKGINVPGVTPAAKAFRFTSAWVLCEEGKTIEMSGSDRFKYATPRWYTTRGDVYGRSPAMTVLPEIRMANRMRDTLLRSKEKQADPPFLMPDGKLMSPLRLFAGGFSFTDGDVQPQSLIAPGTNTNSGDLELQSTRDAIREGFFVPLFATPDAPVKTATQVLQETDERNRAVSPMIIRMHEELLKPMLIETLMILDEAGILPDPPAGFENIELDIEYISPILAAQQTNEALATIRILEGLAPWIQATENAAILDKFNEEEVAMIQHRGFGGPASMLASEEAIAAARRRRRETEAQQQEQQNLLTTSEIAKNFGQSDVPVGR